MAVFELSSEKYKNGRRPFTAVLYELQPPECVVDDVGTKYNKNGITFLEEYAKNQLDSIKDMSVTVSFLDDGKTIICDHGDTDLTLTESDIPKFENATVVGHFTSGYIDDVVISGEKKRCVLGRGLIDEMRYPAFVKALEEELNNGMTVSGSIEIFRPKGHKTIVYKHGCIPKGRIPVDYIHTGWAMVINPSDVASALVELNSQKKEQEEILMDEKTMRDVIVNAINEVNSKNDDYDAKIQELNDVVEEKDGKIKELAGKVEENTAADKTKADEIQKLKDRVAELESELDECKKTELNSSLEKALELFSEDEQKYAAEEINTFKQDPLKGDVDAIVNKIYSKIGQASKETEKQKSIEKNSAEKNDEFDIFSEISSVDDSDDSIF